MNVGASELLDSELTEELEAGVDDTDFELDVLPPPEPPPPQAASKSDEDKSVSRESERSWFAIAIAGNTPFCDKSTEIRLGTAVERIESTLKPGQA